MRKQLDAFLWRRCNQATLDTLLGVSDGQYDIRLLKRDYIPFFRGLTQTNPTKLNGFDIVLTIQPFNGSNPVQMGELVIRYMGPLSKRKDWNIRSQRPTTAYELWRDKRGFETRANVGQYDFIIIARDTDNDFHARWIRTEDFKSLPLKMQQHMTKVEAGWEIL